MPAGRSVVAFRPYIPAEVTTDERLVLLILKARKSAGPAKFLELLQPFNARGGNREWPYAALAWLVARGRVRDLSDDGVGPFQLVGGQKVRRQSRHQNREGEPQKRQ